MDCDHDQPPRRNRDSPMHYHCGRSGSKCQENLANRPLRYVLPGARMLPSTKNASFAAGNVGKALSSPAIQGHLGNVGSGKRIRFLRGRGERTVRASRELIMIPWLPRQSSHSRANLVAGRARRGPKSRHKHGDLGKAGLGDRSRRPSQAVLRHQAHRVAGDK